MTARASTPQPTPESILLIRLSAIGDVVMASGLIPALRRAYPQSRLSWLVQPEAAGLLQAHPALDEVIVWPREEWRRLGRQRRWLALAREVQRFRRDLRRRGFDLALDLQGLYKSAVWAYLSGARQRVGLVGKEGIGWLLSRQVERPQGDLRFGSEYRRLAEVLGADAGDYAPSLVLSQADEDFAADFRDQYGHYAVLCPFTTRPQKHWVAGRWPELAAALAHDHGLRPVLVGGPGDRAEAEAMVDGAPLVNMVGQTRLSQTAALIKGAGLLVGVDTGLTHMGIAFGVPTVTLFGSTCPYRQTGRPNARVIYHALACSPCRRHPTCGGTFDCLTGISVAEVRAAADDVFNADVPVADRAAR